MSGVYIAWSLSAVVLILSVNAFLGRGFKDKPHRFWGFLLEERKGGARYSLTRFQVILWTIIVLSLLAGVFFARLFSGVPNPQLISIPNELLILMGISLGSATLSTAIKTNKDASKETHIHSGYPKLGDLIRVEEGAKGTWNNIALEKFQNFWITILVMVAFIATAIAWIESINALPGLTSAQKLARLDTLPLLSGTWNTLLGISHAAYISLKAPNKPSGETTAEAAAGTSGQASETSLADRNRLAIEVTDLTTTLTELFERFIEDKTSDTGNLVRKFGFHARELTDYEIHEAQKIFGSKINYGRVRIFEGAGLPNFLDDIGRFIKRMPRREIGVKNAITLGNHCFFGRTLKTDEITDPDTRLDANQLNEMSWLVHELTHVWQFQSMGWIYLWKAWGAQSELGEKVYDFGGEQNLRSEKQRGAALSDFNLEQQGHIVQKYYEKLKREQDTSAFDPFVQQI